jgi:hypothetical protein
MLNYFTRFANTTVIPEAILPVQFFQKGDHIRGEEKLLLALIENAWFDVEKYYTKSSRHAKRRYAEAIEWFLDDSAAAQRWLCSFVNATSYLRIEPELIRAKIRELHAFYNPVEKGPCGDREKSASFFRS